MATHTPAVDSADSDNQIAAARTLYSVGDALAAFDLLSRLTATSHTLQSRQLLIAAALRGGALGQAHELLDALQSEGHIDEETLGLLAREAKSRWLQGESAALAEARDAYLRAFRATGGLWTGVNAATLSLIAGDAAAAVDLAHEVLRAGQELSLATRSEFWTIATAAEAALILGDQTTALAQYQQAVAVAPHAFGDHRSARDNARAILRAQGQLLTWLDQAFPRVTVAAFTGHMVDAPHRVAARFPPSEERSVAAAFADAIDAHGIDIGVCAAANGADILFLEAMQAAGKETRIVLPFPAEEFRRVSVTDTADASWGERFDRVMARADQTTVLAPHRGEDLGFQFHGAVMAGTALLRAEAIGGRTIALALWDGALGGVGGTGAVVKEWAGRGLETLLLPLAGRPGTRMTPEAARSALQGIDLRQAGDQRVVCLLFADAVGFSRLNERQVKTFVQEFWGRTAHVLHGEHAPHLLYANTWGDGLFLVFDAAPAAADAALAIGAMVRRTEWRGLGLPSNTGIRIALHAGPAYEVDDPITGRRGYAGMHIARAARIEPVTPPGQIYASEAFAALLAFDDKDSRFQCEYVGTVPLAKSYGRLRTYRLTRH